MRPAIILAVLLFPAPCTLAGDRPDGRLTMALVCLKCQPTDTADARQNQANLRLNLDRHLAFIDRAAARGADFVGFPELSLNGYHFSGHTTWLRRDGPEVQALARQARERRVHVSAGLAEQDADGKRWNTQVLLGPDGRLIGWHHKIWLTAERGHTEKGREHRVFAVQGVRLGICTCADGTDFGNLEALVRNGAQVIYAPHANTTGGTLAGWYRFRARWGGIWDGKIVMSKTSNDGPVAPMPSGGWISKLKVHAALHNHAAGYDAALVPAKGDGGGPGWASGAWFIGPDGRTLAQVPSSTRRADSKEYLLIHTITVQAEPAAKE